MRLRAGGGRRALPLAGALGALLRAAPLVCPPHEAYRGPTSAKRDARTLRTGPRYLARALVFVLLPWPCQLQHSFWKKIYLTFKDGSARWTHFRTVCTHNEAGQGTTPTDSWEEESARQHLGKAPVEESASRGGKSEICRRLGLGVLGSWRSADTLSLMAWGWLPHARGMLDTLK